MVVTAHLSPKEVGNELSMPGFTAEASIYRTENYWGIEVNGARDAFQAVEAALIREQPPINMRITAADFSFQTPWLDCFCSTTEGWCSCVPR